MGEPISKSPSAVLVVKDVDVEVRHAAEQYWETNAKE